MKIELIYGTEPYLVREYREDVVKGIAMPDFNVLVSGQFTDAERDFARQAPLFSDRKVLVLELEKLSADDMLEKYLKDPSERTELYIFAKDVDRRLGIYKKFPKGRDQTVRQGARNAPQMGVGVCGGERVPDFRIGIQ